ncbi:hypothetical protein [Streptomyces parvus]|nr:hypothetical protein [Streptomyces parvus]
MTGDEQDQGLALHLPHPVLPEEVLDVLAQGEGRGGDMAEGVGGDR